MTSEAENVLNFSLTEREVKLIVESLRGNEFNSRKGFGQWLAANVDGIGGDVWNEKTARAAASFKELATLQAKFGDVVPIKGGAR